MTPTRPAITRRVLLLACLGAGVVYGLNAPMTTRQGVNFKVSTQAVPLYVKTLDFLHRHAHYQLLAKEITQDLHSDRERVVAVFVWTRQHIRPTPKGWPVVDDHILNIIIRGHGIDDQRADVFTTLSTYAGVPAFWRTQKVSDSRYRLVLSFARVGGRWVVFDVANGFMFTNGSGDLASAEELGAAPQLVRLTVGDFQYGDGPYERYFASLSSLKVPWTLRAQLQMPWPRVWSEVRRMVGLGT